MVRIIENSGKSKEEAIIILDANDPEEGIGAEYKYLERKYGKKGVDWELVIQRLHKSDGKSYDEMIIRLKNGDEKTLYFDITEFYNFYRNIYSNFKNNK